MATITTLALGSTYHPSLMGETKVYVADVIIDFAKAATAKGSALVNGDVIEALKVPANTLILQAGYQVVVAQTGASNDNTLSLGTGADIDQWVDAFDIDAAAADAQATLVAPATTEPTRFLASADTIDLAWEAGTTLPTAGKVRVWAVLVDVSGNTRAPGLVALGS